MGCCNQTTETVSHEKPFHIFLGLCQKRQQDAAVFWSDFGFAEKLQGLYELNDLIDGGRLYQVVAS